MSTRFFVAQSMHASPAPQPSRVDIHLEELGQHSWIKSLLSTLTGSYGSTQVRFVARAAGEHVDDEHIAAGATFSVMRLQDLDDRTEPNAWTDTADERLRELDAELTDAGWSRDETTGPHWWSLSYRRRPNQR